MLSKLRFPLLYVIEYLLWLPLMAGFAITVSFVAAKPISVLNLQGKSLPASWEAAVPNHGSYFQGYLISGHPLAFTMGLALIVVAAAALWPVHKAQAAQRETAEASRQSSYRIATAVLGAAILVTAYSAFTLLLGSTAPA